MTETLIPPPVETPDIIDGDIDIPEMVAHLYAPFTLVTLCGISHKEDPHERMHIVENLPPGEWVRGRRECPQCGAPTCEKCEARALAREKENK